MLDTNCIGIAPKPSKYFSTDTSTFIDRSYLLRIDPAVWRAQDLGTKIQPIPSSTHSPVFSISTLEYKDNC